MFFHYWKVSAFENLTISMEYTMGSMDHATPLELHWKTPWLGGLLHNIVRLCLVVCFIVCLIVRVCFTVRCIACFIV